MSMKRPPKRTRKARHMANVSVTRFLRLGSFATESFQPHHSTPKLSESGTPEGEKMLATQATQHTQVDGCFARV